MPYLQTSDRVSLFYNDWGKGRPVVLIHGWPLDSDMWEYQATALVDAGFRVIAYDRRGFGRSDQPATGYDYDTFAADLAAIVDGLQLTDAALVGFSMGGGEVVRYLSRHGSTKVSRAVLIGAVTPMLLQTNDNPDGVPKAVFDEMVAGLQKDRPAFLADFAKGFYGVGLLSHPVSDALLQWTAHLAYRGSALATRACVRAFSETDFRADVRALTVPTLIIHGEKDATVPVDKSAKQAAALAPKARLEVYEGAAHGLYATHTHRLNQDLITFLR